MRKPFSRLRDGLARTRRAITEGIRGALRGGLGLDDDALAGIEETLIAADLGVDTSLHLTEALRSRLGAGASEGDIRTLLAAEVEKILLEAEGDASTAGAAAPRVVLVAGVNGVGKTTTSGKLAHMHRDAGKSVILAAADTFRAAAGEQLAVWAERSGARLVAGNPGGDAAAVAYDALSAAVARSADVLIIDTAGRLHTQRNLMTELAKVRRVLAGRMPGAPHEVLLVVDANTGQNALSQARLFDEVLGLTGLVLTKLDGTARGGIVVAIARELSVPVRYVGTGEQVEDLQAFDAAAFAQGLLGVGERGGDPA